MILRMASDALVHQDCQVPELVDDELFIRATRSEVRTRTGLR
jgi:hypothetical protein